MSEYLSFRGAVFATRNLLPLDGQCQKREYPNDVVAVFHRPHPQKEIDKGAVKSLRRFLTEAGITP